ncbi:MAG: outer membrane protein [Candidatus Zixiibacteriota bacterium]
MSLLWVPVVTGFLVLSSGLVEAQIQVSDSQEKSSTFNQRHQAGIRIGLWHNLGDDAVVDSTFGGLSWKTDIGNNNFYFEAFGAYRINSLAMAELSFGFVNRGSVTLYEDPYSYVGNLLVYSIMLQLKVYPVPTLPGRFHPFLMGGGGLFYGRHDVQFTTDYDFFYYFNEKSATDFNYVIGGGVDWQLTDYLGVDFSVKYMPIGFNKDLVTMTDYDALTFSAGVKYLFESSK